MKEKPIKNDIKSQTDKKKLHSKNERSIDYSDSPATSADFWADAQEYMPSHKVHVSMRLDDEIIDFFKKDGQGYQSRINAVLKAYVRNHAKKHAA